MSNNANINVHGQYSNGTPYFRIGKQNGNLSLDLNSPTPSCEMHTCMAYYLWE